MVEKGNRKINIGIIGLGNRGLKTLERYFLIDEVEIKALCELRRENIEKAVGRIKQVGRAMPELYTGKDGWMELCRNGQLDVVLICTDWLTHAPMAVYAMEHGREVALEVPAAMSVDECWQLVNTSERMERQCTMLENCCYDAFALATLEMKRKGAFGEIVHTEGAYIHDIRNIYFADEQKGGFHKQWNINYCKSHTGNPYPTHGLGPLCQLLDINRGDRLEYLVSMSSKQAGIYEFEGKIGKSEGQRCQYELGDVNNTLIRTAKGKTIRIEYCTTLPRPYSRIHTVCGTRGYAQKYPLPTIMIEGEEASSEELLRRFQHPFTERIGKIGKQRNAPNEMNFIMDYRLVETLQSGQPFDIDVYDAATWSCITELSELSVRRGGEPVEIPDFTRGKWKRD